MDKNKSLDLLLSRSVNRMTGVQNIIFNIAQLPIFSVVYFRLNDTNKAACCTRSIVSDLPENKTAKQITTK